MPSTTCGIFRTIANTGAAEASISFASGTTRSAVIPGRGVGCFGLRSSIALAGRASARSGISARKFRRDSII